MQAITESAAVKLILPVILLALAGVEMLEKQPETPVNYAAPAEVENATTTVEQRLADLESRVANLEKACIDGKPKAEAKEEPKKSYQSPPKRKLLPRERVKAIVYYTDGCLPCDQLKAEITKELCGSLGWTAGDTDNCDIIYRESNSWETYPTIEIRVDDSVKRRILGRIPAAEISRILKQAIDTLDREA